MDKIPKELEENQLRLEVFIDPETNFLTMKTHLDDKSEPVELMQNEVVTEDPLLQPDMEPIDFEKMSELDHIIYFERARLLNLQLPKKNEILNRSKDGSYDWEAFEADSNHQLTQSEKSRLRMKKLREKETEEEHEFRKFRGRVRKMKARLLLKLQNFEDESFLKEIQKRACDKVKQKRLQRRANETADQQALRKNQVNLARRKLFLRNKLFSTPEDVLREKEKRLRYLERTWSQRSEEQRNDKRKHATQKAREKRKQDKKEWKMIQKAIKGKIPEGVKITSQLTEDV